MLEEGTVIAQAWGGTFSVIGDKNGPPMPTRINPASLRHPGAR